MSLSPRLETIVSFVEKNSIVADIGTDHGYIPVYLIENDISKKVIATDVNEGPLNSAKSYIEKKRLQGRIETRLGDGIRVIRPYEVDTIIIAGMGGLLIKKIIQQSKNVADTIENFILQPMIASDELRRFLYNNNYKIKNERLVKEGDKIYEIIHAIHGKDEVKDEIFYDIGKKLVENKDPLLNEFISKKLEKIERILVKIDNNNSIKGRKKSENLKKKYNKLMEVLNSL